MKKIIFSFCILTTSLANCQKSIAELLYNNTILIEFETGEFGSGMILKDDLNFYLVTARHVLLDENQRKKGEYLLKAKNGFVRYYSDNANLKTLDINFYGLFNKGKLKFENDADILICKIGQLDTFGFPKLQYDEENVKKLNPISSIRNFDINDIASFDETILGNDIFVFGYPKVLGLNGTDQFDFNQPILRKGAVASKYYKNKTIIIDCPSFGGNSGGPVVEVFNESFVPEFKLIGIVVSFIPYAEIWTNARYNIKNMELVNSGYSVIEPIEKVYSLIKQIK